MIPLVKDTFLFENETKKALAEFVVKAQKLSFGDECRKFEREFSVFQEREYAILFNSGGSANLALLQALKNLGYLKNGDKVAFSAVTWSTNVMPIIQLGLIPIPVDCHRETLNCMSDNLKDVLKETDIDAFFITNVLGFAGDLSKIKNICKNRGIILLEDNCESLGTELKTGKTGNFGLASTFSFYVSHHMSTIEGGMICTDNEELTQMLKLVRANGWDRNLEDEEKESFRRSHSINSDLDAKYAFYDLGYNLRPTEITGFLGSYQLQFIENSLKQRQETYIKVESAITKNTDLIPVKYENLAFLSNFAIPIICKTLELRNFYSEKFNKAGIEIRPLIAGNIQKQPFYSKYVSNKRNLPESDFIHQCALYCGNHPSFTKEDVGRIVKCLENKPFDFT